ncbi:MAG: hypothetical protein Tsb0034_31140 [Ekhidna sp.]
MHTAIRAFIATLYELISGAENEPRDWGRWEGLFAKEARLHIIDYDGVLKSVTTKEWIADYEKQFNGNSSPAFYEYELSSDISVKGNVIHVMSEYASTLDMNEEPFKVGYNSFQLIPSGDSFKVVSIFWDRNYNSLNIK